MATEVEMRRGRNELGRRRWTGPVCWAIALTGVLFLVLWSVGETREANIVGVSLGFEPEASAVDSGSVVSGKKPEVLLTRLTGAREAVETGQSRERRAAGSRLPVPAGDVEKPRPLGNENASPQDGMPVLSRVSTDNAQSKAAEEAMRVAHTEAKAAYPPGTFDVDLSDADPRGPILVQSWCESVPDYYIVPLFMADALAGLVVLNTTESGELTTASIHPFGPAFVGQEADTLHGRAREAEFPPVSPELALSLAQAELGTADAEKGAIPASVAPTYYCPSGVAGPQVAFLYTVHLGRATLYVDALSGEIVDLSAFDDLAP